MRLPRLQPAHLALRQHTRNRRPRAPQLMYERRRDFAFQRGACGTERLARLQLAACRLQALPHWVRALPGIASSRSAA